MPATLTQDVLLVTPPLVPGDHPPLPRSEPRLSMVSTSELPSPLPCSGHVHGFQGCDDKSCSQPQGVSFHAGGPARPGPIPRSRMQA